jgi:hypothetical protein
MYRSLVFTAVAAALAAGLVFASGSRSTERRGPDPLLAAGAKRYAATMRDERASLQAARAAGDALAVRLHRGRLAPADRAGVADPLAVVRAAVALLSGDARSLGPAVSLLDVEGHAAGTALAFDAIRDAVWARDRGLVGAIDERAAHLRAELDRHRRGQGYRPMPAPGTAARRSLEAALDAWAWRLNVAVTTLE